MAVNSPSNIISNNSLFIDQLLSLLDFISNLETIAINNNSNEINGNEKTNNKEVIINELWNVITMLPSNENIVKEVINSNNYGNIINDKSPFKLMYVLNIIRTELDSNDNDWSSHFIKCNGLHVIYNLIVSKEDNNNNNSILKYQPCVASLLDIFQLFLVTPNNDMSVTLNTKYLFIDYNVLVHSLLYLMNLSTLSNQIITLHKKGTPEIHLTIIKFNFKFRN